MYIVGAGVLYGFVATLAKVAIERICTSAVGLADLVACIVALAGRTGSAPTSCRTPTRRGRPISSSPGLTVIDPLVAVTIGIVVLDEAAGAPWWAMVGFALTGAVAVFGVFQLAKYHPQSSTDAPVADAARRRGSRLD